jgi:hypothetical protein
MPFRHLLICIVSALLIGCSGLPSEAEAPAEQLGGGYAPAAVAEGFFISLGKALKDQNLGSEAVRATYVEELALYFAPDERETQRDLIDRTLQGFAEDRAKLAEDEELTLEITFDTPLELSRDGSRALVAMPNAIIFMQISRKTERGFVPIYEQPISLERLIGRADGAVPTIEIGGLWYLTEG